jgi:hypothetical protein
MPIKVRCPNPSCDRIHLVKNKYAGLRGRCPACGNWLLVPRLTFSTSSPLPPALPRELKAEVSKPTIAPSPSAPQQTKRPFSKGALVLLLLAALSAGSMALVPFVDQPALHLTGDLHTSVLSEYHLGVRPEALPWVIGVPATAAALTLLAFLLGLARRKFDFLPLCPTYLALFLGWGLLVLAGFIFRDHLTLVSLLQQQASELHGIRIGALSVSWGESLFIGLGGAIGGFLLPGLALVRMHRSLPARVLVALLVVVLLSGAGAVLFAGELGLEQIQISL